MKKNRESCGIRIDFPRPSEKIEPRNSYSFRMETTLAGPVEVSIDDGPWVRCRPGIGYWWFDWSGGKPGRHQVGARVLCKGGTVTTPRCRRFFVRS